MKLILTYKGQRVKEIETEDDECPLTVTDAMLCLSCKQIHEQVFVHQGLHDDGEIFIHLHDLNGTQIIDGRI